MRHCERVVSHSRSSRRTSHHCSRKLVSTTATGRTTDLSPTCRSCQSCWNVSSCIDFLKIKSNGLLPSVQSAYRKFHSTEAALAKVLSDILMALDQGNVAALAVLDLSAVFDTVDHRILLCRLLESCGIDGMALSRITSYLTDRQQRVCHAGSQSTSQHISFGVWKGSVLRPLLFVLYTADLAPLIDDHRLHPDLYVDNTQVYMVGADRVTDLCQHASSQDVAVHRRRLELDTQQQAASKPCKD